MRRLNVLFATVALALFAIPALPAAAQSADQLSNRVQRYVSVDAPVVAVTGVTLIDGTGAPARRNQTVVIRDGRIAGVGATGSTAVPAGAEVVDGTGHTLIPGMMGLHNHLYYTAAGGRAAQLTYSAPRLYLGAGVTTVRTTGSRNAYAEINLKHEVENGREPGPRIHITAPYITGGSGTTTMTLIESPEAARRFVEYWAAEGATWLKAYTNVGRDEMAAAIDEAHRRGIKVTGHICSISFTEAAELGIDNIEHGLLTNSDYHPEKERGRCPTDYRRYAGEVDPYGPQAKATFDAMISRGIPMTSTLAVYELFVANRDVRDPRALEAMAPEVRADYIATRDRIDAEGGSISLEFFRNSMAYEKAFVEAGGVLASGVDPTGNGGALPGYGDQRNVELLSEAGFTPEQVVQIVSYNGARVLGVDAELGSVEVGKVADLVLMRGDLTADPSAIRQVVTVFKDGVGYDSAALLADVRGRVGIS